MSAERAQKPQSGGKLLPCPRCKNEVEDLLKIDVGMKLAIEQSGHKDQFTPQVCPKCYTDLSNMISQGARLRANKQKETFNRKVLWKNRVGFLKQARNLMSVRAYPEAAVLYEKYIKSVAVGFEKKPTEIHPDLFKDPRHRKELSVLTYVFWDLYKIYDTDPKYEQRLMFAAEKLKVFAMSGSQQEDIARKLENYEKFSNNRAVFKDLTKALNANVVRCFIATAAFSSRQAPEVLTLCAFRDQILSQYFLGRIFIKTYYRISPPIAEFLDHQPQLKNLVRKVLRITAMRLKEIFSLKDTPEF